MVGKRQLWLATRMLGLAAVLVAVMLATAGGPAPASAQAAPFGWGNIQICTDVNFGGACAWFRFDVPEFGATPIGNDRASSLSVPPGNVVALYEHKNYQGRCMTVAGDYSEAGYPDLRYSYGAIGNDQASSMRVGVECYPGTTLVTICQDAYFGGRCASFPAPFLYWVRADDPNPMNRLGDNAASSVRVPAGRHVDLLQGGGSSVQQRLCTSALWLWDKPIGDNTVSSVSSKEGSC